LEHRNQSEDRIYRIGQNSHCLYLDVNAPNTVNYGMATSLRKKINLAGEVMGDKWRKWLV
jgi:SNF2 family DNA or RNA helicase